MPFSKISTLPSRRRKTTSSAFGFRWYAVRAFSDDAAGAAESLTPGREVAKFATVAGPARVQKSG